MLAPLLEGHAVVRLESPRPEELDLLGRVLSQVGASVVGLDVSCRGPQELLPVADLSRFMAAAAAHSGKALLVLK